jgi:pimeloyl-ACP methyl ester carboxylesterase
METESGYIKVDNAMLYYEIAGAGSPLVMIHAGVADSRQWDNEFPYLAQNFRVLRYDMRGFGKSLPADGDYSNLVDLETLLNRLQLQEPLILIGCSMGGALAMDFSLAYPEKVKALVMVASGPSGLRLDVPGHPQEEAAAAAYKAGDLDLLAELEAQIWFDGMGRTVQQVNQQMRGLAREMNRLALAHDAQQLGKRLADTDNPAANRLRELRIPVLILIGENDIPYLQAAADTMVEDVENNRKVIILDAGHLPNMEHPDEFRHALDAFFDEMLG